jgi:hypothetical protein
MSAVALTALTSAQDIGCAIAAGLSLSNTLHGAKLTVAQLLKTFFQTNKLRGLKSASEVY